MCVLNPTSKWFPSAIAPGIEWGEGLENIGRSDIKPFCKVMKPSMIDLLQNQRGSVYLIVAREGVKFLECSLTFLQIGRTGKHNEAMNYSIYFIFFICVDNFIFFQFNTLFISQTPPKVALKA